MCDPITIAGVALTGASVAANSIAARRADNARTAAMSAERARQSKLSREAAALNTRSQDRYRDFEGQREDKSKSLGDYFQDQAGAEAAPPSAGAANVGGSAIAPTSSNITIANEGIQRNDARNFTNQQGAALGDLRSFGELMGDIGRLQARDASEIGTINGFKKASADVLPYELEAAQSKGSGLKMLGDILGGLGGIATNAGAGGGAFGFSAAAPKAVAAPAATPFARSAGVPSLINTPFAYSPFGSAR